MMGLRKSPLCALALCALVRAAPAEVRKPPLPPGRDPGGVAVALFTTGIDYTDPEVAVRLARDGEGELIGWDAADADNRPFAARGGAANWGGDGTLLARALGGPGRRLVAVRIGPTDPASLARAVAFIAATPARIAVVPMWSSAKATWEPFRQAVLQHGDLLLIAAAGDEGKDIDREPVWPAAFQLARRPGAPARSMLRPTAVPAWSMPWSRAGRGDRRLPTLRWPPCWRRMRSPAAGRSSSPPTAAGR